MRILITSDLHFNHAASRPVAEALIDEVNLAGGDVLLVVGDTAVADGDWIERCLGRFQFSGPKLFVPGNHELWTNGLDSHALYVTALPDRVRAVGWHWLDGNPWRDGDVGIVGNLGWYDGSFAPIQLGIPQRFYEAKVAPGVATRLDEYAWLEPGADDVPPESREIFARWNDGVHVKLGRPDKRFLFELNSTLERDLESLADARQVIAAIHHLPFRELLPPMKSAQWDFAKAFLGADQTGKVLANHANVTHVYSGHSHFKAAARVGNIEAIATGCGYREKSFYTLDV